MQRALLGGFFRERVAGRAFSAELRIVDRESAQVLGGFDGRLTLGWASRPSSGRWIFLERADWIATDGLGGSSATRNRRLVNNWNASFVPNAANELGLQYAVKLVSYDGEAWSGESFLDLLGVEWRRQLAAKLDVGLHVSVYRAPSAGIVERGTGFDFGINVATNLELAVGYNFTGFADEDFSAAGYTAAGPFVTFRLKIDQASLRDLLRR